MLKKIFTLVVLAGMAIATVRADEGTDSLTIDSLLLERLLFAQNLEFQTGEVEIAGIAKIKVPAGFKFLDAAQSQRVLTELWNNPPDESTLGLLFPEDMAPYSDDFTYVVEISYSAEGHIKDDDAEGIDYDDLLKQMQQDTRDGNGSRAMYGYPSIELVGWAAQPYYDKENKKLHWAKELHFEGSEENTLNYNIRVLGRKGVLLLNVIGDMSQLEAVNSNVNTILASVEFNKGHTYFDFDPSIDQVAAYGVGGLIAGKVLAKTGVLAVLLKFWKIIAMAVVAAFAAVKKFFFGNKRENPYTNQNG